jgi:hypothetical protein
MPDQEETKPKAPAFDFNNFPEDTLFYERRDGAERRLPPEAELPPEPEPPPPPKVPGERRAKKERRRRIDPTTFEKQYTDDELEFMNAMQRFKVQTGKSFPSHGEVLGVAFSLGYRQVVAVDDDSDDSAENGGIDQYTDHNVFQDQH